MPRDLRERIGTTRLILAWGLLAAIMVGLGFALPHLRTNPALRSAAATLFWILAAYAGIRALAFLLLDPLLRQRRNATPGFARDLLVVLLYFIAAAVILRKVTGVGLEKLLGTGAIAAAVVGLSLQEVLGNLFSGISLHLDPVFQVGDWIEVTGNLRGGPGRETLVGQVEAMTWRTVQLRTENGDMDIFPNRVIAQAVVTNLYVPSGLHRRTGKVVVEPTPDLHIAVDKLTVSLAGIPHPPEHRPEVVVQGSDMGGAVLEMRWWALGFRHGRSGNFLAMRLANSVLPREGFSLLGPHGATTPHPRNRAMGEGELEQLLRRLDLPPHWAPELRGHLQLRHTVPGEGIIREGDPGETLFFLLKGRAQVVRGVERSEPYTGIYWEALAELGEGDWFGEASLLTGAPRNATVVALGPCELVEVPKLAFEQCLKQEPNLLDRLVDLMERRAREQEAHLPEARARRREQWLRQMKSWFGI